MLINLTGYSIKLQTFNLLTHKSIQSLTSKLKLSNATRNLIIL